MTFKAVAIIASLSGAVLSLSWSDASAGPAGGNAAVAAVPFVRPGVPITPRPPFRHHHRRNFVGGFWPGSGFYYDDMPYREPLADASLPLTNDVNYTYTYKQDVPWDWAHRYPPIVAPSDRPYVPACSSEPVTVPGRFGDQTVNVIRCY